MEYRSFCPLSIIYYICSEDIWWIWSVCFHCWFWLPVVVFKVIESLVYLDISYGIHVNHHHVLVQHDTIIQTEEWENRLPLMPLGLFMVSFICSWLYFILICHRHTVNTFCMFMYYQVYTRGIFIPINKKSKAMAKYDTDRQTNNFTQHTTHKTKI